MDEPPKSLEIPDPPADLEPDQLAQDEQDAMGRGEVPTPWDQEEIRNDFRRRQRLKDAVNWLFVGMVSVGGLALILLFGTWVAHLFLPDQYHWISADQVDRIQVILFSGTISSLLTLVGKRIVS